MDIGRLCLPQYCILTAINIIESICKNAHENSNTEEKHYNFDPSTHRQTHILYTENYSHTFILFIFVCVFFFPLFLFNWGCCRKDWRSINNAEIIRVTSNNQYNYIQQECIVKRYINFVNYKINCMVYIF